MKRAGMILTSAAVAAMTLTPVAASAQSVRAQVGQWCAETATRTDAPGQTWHQTYCTGNVAVVDDVDAVVVEQNWVPIAGAIAAAALVAGIFLIADDDDDDEDNIPVSP